MAQDLMRYDHLMQEASRQVVRSALERACSPDGLPGQHHFYISFLTHADGVDIADYLKEEYPEEMTIVLEHQFWDLEISDSHFEVTLKFKEIPQHLFIPFRALTRFYDPSVNFGLPLTPDKSENIKKLSVQKSSRPSDVSSDDSSSTSISVEPIDKEDAQESETAEEKTGEVVNLDSFRKR